MQEVPGFGVIRSDNPIVAEVLIAVAHGMYPEGTSEGLDETPDERRERCAASVERLGGLGLIEDFVNEYMEFFTGNVSPVELLMAPRGPIGATLSIGIQIGAELERRRASEPVID